MPNKWFANWGQVFQLLLMVISIAVAIILRAGLPSAPPWVVPAFFGIGIGLTIGLGVQKFVKAKRPASNPLKLVGTEFTADDRVEITYKRKLYITLLNTSAGAVIVGPQTTWIDKDLHVNTVREHVWEVEGGRGWRNKDWIKEAAAVRVNPGKRLRTWVGLPIDAKKTEVDLITAEHRAGALSTSVTSVNEMRIDV
jgi:hypothetical protein